MAEGPYLMGIDYGTGGVRVGIFDVEGTPVVFHAVEFGTSYPRSGRAEQDPDTWWSSLVEAVHGAMEQSGVASEDIAGIGVDTTAATVLAMDANDRPLRPAIMWMDVRAVRPGRAHAETGDPALKYNGFGSVSAEWGLPKCLWLKEQGAEDVAGRRHICDAVDWLINRLTGEWTASINIAAPKYHHDRDEGGFPVSAAARPSASRTSWRSTRRTSWTWVSSSVACARTSPRSWACRPGTPVAEGGIDGFVGQIGLGVIEPGKLALITGSSHALLGQVAEPIHGRGFWGAYTDAVMPGQYTVEAGQVSTGSIVAWFKNHFAKGADGGGHASAASIPTWSSTSWPATSRSAPTGSIVAGLLPGQPHAAHRSAGARDDLGPVARPRPRGTCSAPSSRASATAPRTSSGPSADTTSSRG